MKIRNLGILWLVTGIICSIVGIIFCNCELVDIQMIFMGGLAIGVGIIVILFSLTKEWRKYEVEKALRGETQK